MGKSNENSLLVAEYAVGIMMYLAKNFNEYLIPVNKTSKIKMHKYFNEKENWNYWIWVYRKKYSKASIWVQQYILCKN